MVLLVNQHTVPVFLDIANAFASAGSKTVLFTGYIEQGGRPLSASVHLKKSISYNRKSTVSRFFSWLAFAFHYAFYLLTCRRPEVVLVSTNPPLAPVITAVISRWRKIPYQVLLYDLYPEALFQAGLVKRRNPIFRFWQRINPWIFKGAQKIFTLSDSMKDAASGYIADPGKVKVIYNWADTSYVHPVEKSTNDFIRQHRLENKFVVLYAGNMGLTHDLESLIEAAHLLKDLPDLQFVFIGDGGKRRALQNLVRERALGNVVFLPYQDERNFPLAMAAADVGVVTLGSGAEGISVPSKTYINLAAGVCLLSIAPKNSELSRLVREYEAGQICEPGNPQEVAGFIKTLMANPGLLNHYKRKAVEAAAFFTPDNAYEYIAETRVRQTVTF